jgi:hypothetical protein
MISPDEPRSPDELYWVQNSREPGYDEAQQCVTDVFVA